MDVQWKRGKLSHRRTNSVITLLIYEIGIYKHIQGILGVSEFGIENITSLQSDEYGLESLAFNAMGCACTEKDVERIILCNYMDFFY